SFAFSFVAIKLLSRPRFLSSAGRTRAAALRRHAQSIFCKQSRCMVRCAEAFWEQEGCCVVILGAAVDLIPCRPQIQWSVTTSAINQARFSLWIAPPGLQLHSAC